MTRVHRLAPYGHSGEMIHHPTIEDIEEAKEKQIAAMEAQLKIDICGAVKTLMSIDSDVFRKSLQKRTEGAETDEQ